MRLSSQYQDPPGLGNRTAGNRAPSSFRPVLEFYKGSASVENLTLPFPIPPFPTVASLPLPPSLCSCRLNRSRSNPLQPGQYNPWSLFLLRPRYTTGTLIFLGPSVSPYHRLEMGFANRFRADTTTSASLSDPSSSLRLLFQVRRSLNVFSF